MAVSGKHALIGLPEIAERVAAGVGARDAPPELQTFQETKHVAQAKQLDTLFEWQAVKSDIPNNTSPEVVG